MNKVLIAIAAAFFAITTFFAAPAEAGFNVKIGAAPQFSTLHKAGCSKRRRFHRNRFYLARRLAAKRRALAARKARARAIAKAKAKARAKAKALAAANAAAAEEAEVAEATETENSSVSLSETDELAETKKEETKKVASVARDLGCKKFIPEVGMTVTVSCE
jgi:hypothetical protein